MIPSGVTRFHSLFFYRLVMQVQTNIVIFELSGDATAETYLNKLDDKGIKAVGFGPKEIRLVTHLDFNDEMLEKSIEILKTIE